MNDPDGIDISGLDALADEIQTEGDYHRLLADQILEQCGTADVETATVHGLLAIACELREIRKVFEK